MQFYVCNLLISNFGSIQKFLFALFNIIVLLCRIDNYSKENNIAMKINILFFLLCLLLQAKVAAQAFISEVQTINHLDPLDAGIVRDWDANRTIHCGLKNNKYFLFLCDNSNFYIPNPVALPNYSFEWPSTIPIKNIYDMKVIGDYTYLCGESKNNYGFVAYFDNNDFFRTTLSLYYDEVSCVNKLSKLVVYDDYTTNHKVVAIGQQESNIPPYGYVDYVVVEIDDANTLTPTTQFMILGQDDVLFEVLYTLNQELYFIEYNLFYKALAIRKAAPSAVVSTSLIESLHYYQTSDDEVYSPTHSADEPDLLAVSYMYGGYGSGTFDTRIRYFDFNTLDMYNSQEFWFPDKSEPYDMVYCKKNGWVPILMQPFVLGGTLNTNFIPLQPHTFSGYTATAYYHPNEIYYSADRMKPDFEYFMATGRKYRYQQDAGFNFTPTPTCPTPDNVKVQIISNVRHLIQNTLFRNDTWNWNPFQTPCTVNSDADSQCCSE